MTAKGSTLSNGAANFFVLHRDPIDLAESASMAFLGLSLTCARCHNHPIEKWTQDQYYGFASLFARVKLKDGETAGEMIVTAATEGEILHPRRGVAMPAAAARWPAGRRLATATIVARRSPTGSAEPENPYFARAVVNRVWSNFFGRGSDRSRGRPARYQPAERRGPARLAGGRLRCPSLRRQAPDPDDHDLGRLCAVERPAGAGQRVGHEVPQPLPGQAAAGRGPAGRDLPGLRSKNR